MNTPAALTSAPRAKSVEVTVRLTDGTVQTLVMTDPRDVTVNVDYAAVVDDPWGVPQYVAAVTTRIEKVTIEIEQPRNVEERISRE